MKYRMRYLKLFEELKMDTNHLNVNTGLSIHKDVLTLYDSSKEKVLATIGLSEYENYYTFPMVAAEKGYGPLIYELALMYVGDKGLMTSRDGDIRGEAFDVWKKMFDRKDVNKKSLELKDDSFNFALITGDDSQVYDNLIEKESEFDYHKEDGYENDIIIYNTKMWMNPTNEYYDLIKKGEKLNHDDIMDDAQNFFNYRYNE